MANRLKRVHWWAAAVTVSENLCRKDLFLSTSSRTEHSQNLKGSKICTIIHSSEKVSTSDANFAKISRILRLNMFKLKTYNVLGSDQYKTTTQSLLFFQPSGRIYRGLRVFLCVALSVLDRANTNLLIQYVVVGDSFGTFSARSQTTIDPKVTKII